jgi:8-oxo-dGTP diphosphatase
VTNYVLGFLFDSTLQNVALIEKKRPDWQAGRFNGIGGKVEPDETPEDAIEREFAEEAGLEQIPWTKFAVMGGPGWVVHCYCAAVPNVEHVRTMTDEEVSIQGAFDVPWLTTIPNLRWLVPLAQDVLGHQGYEGPLLAAVTYSKPAV